MPTESWKMFDRISATYDRINRILSLGMDQRWRREVAKWLPLKPHLQILDLATGTGDQLFSLFESDAPIALAKGIDLAGDMLKIAEKKAEAKPYSKRIEWCKGDAEKIPFPDASFDAVTFSFGIRNVGNPLRSLQEIYRVLKPQGRCLILEFSLPNPPFRPIYLFYLRHLLPRIGKALSKHPAAYRYLNETIESFPSGIAFCKLLEQASFPNPIVKSMAFGAVTLYIGEKW